MTFPVPTDFFQVLRSVYKTMSNDHVELPAERSTEGRTPSDWAASLDFTLLTSVGDGIVRLSESRGFMPGMGKTLTYYVLARDSGTAEVQYWWEDNIADPDVVVFTVRGRTPEYLERAVKAVVWAMRIHGPSWKDPFPRKPARAAREPVGTAVKGLSDPSRAWATLVPQLNARWTFLEELFEVCKSCGGSALDAYAGACYACNYDGRTLSGWKASPHPPSMRHVAAFGADLEVMRRLDAAVQKLSERLVPWGGAPATKLEWVLAELNHSSDADFRVPPRCIRPVLAALREGDPSIELGLNEGWLTQAQRAWKAASSEKLYRGGADPFEPLSEIMQAGYRVEITGEIARLSCCDG